MILEPEGVFFFQACAKTIYTQQTKLFHHVSISSWTELKLRNKFVFISLSSKMVIWLHFDYNLNVRQESQRLFYYCFCFNKMGAPRLIWERKGEHALKGSNLMLLKNLSKPLQDWEFANGYDWTILKHYWIQLLLFKPSKSNWCSCNNQGLAVQSPAPSVHISKCATLTSNICEYVCGMFCSQVEI